MASISLRRVFDQSKRVNDPVLISQQDAATLENWILRDSAKGDRIRQIMQDNPDYWSLTPDQLAHRLEDYPGIGAAAAVTYAALYTWAIKVRRR